jgi:hypothetical protein
MEKYKSEELVVLLGKVMQCFYSFNQMNLFSRPYLNKPGGIISATPQDAMRVDYYREKFILEMSELYSYFHDKRDEKILRSFHATEEERLKFRKVRHVVAHIEGDLQEGLRVSKDFLESTKPSNQKKDFIVIVKHLRFLASLIRQENFVIGQLKLVLTLYPSDFISPSILKQLFE